MKHNIVSSVIGQLSNNDLLHLMFKNGHLRIEKTSKYGIMPIHEHFSMLDKNIAVASSALLLENARFSYI